MVIMPVWYSGEFSSNLNGGSNNKPVALWDAREGMVEAHLIDEGLWTKGQQRRKSPTRSINYAPLLDWLASDCYIFGNAVRFRGGVPNICDLSAADSASARHAEGHWFESSRLHQASVV